MLKSLLAVSAALLLFASSAVAQTPCKGMRRRYQKAL